MYDFNESQSAPFLQLSLIDEDGCFTKEAGKEFSGLDVLSDGANKILQRIGEDMLHIDMITHSYPYDWRTKKPVIIRASHQWFIDIKFIKDKAIVSQPNLSETDMLLRIHHSRAYVFFYARTASRI